MNRAVTVLFLVVVLSLNVRGQNLISADSLKKHVYYLASDSLNGRGVGTYDGRKAAHYIAGYFEELGIKPLGKSYLHEFYFNLEQTVIKGNNVVGIIEGTDPVLKNEYILLGAHYDHVAFKMAGGNKIIYNGADDNASGTAAIIELGRYLSKNREQLKRSIILVAFDGEESGLIGSHHFVNDQTISTQQIKLMMSIDMIGKYDRSQSLIVGAMETLDSGGELLEKIAQEHNIAIKKTGKEVSNRTDSKFFGYQGIPALHITSGIIQPYHKPNDDAEDIDYQGMEKISSLLYDLTVELAYQPVLKPIKKLVRMKKQGIVPLFQIGLKANMGTSYHTYANEFYNSRARYSGGVGVFSQLKLGNNLALQPELMFTHTATKTDQGIYKQTGITTPVSLVIATTMNELYEMRTYALVGGYYCYNLSGKVDNSTEMFNNAFFDTDYGWQLGFGIEAMRVHIGFAFKVGLKNISKVPTNEIYYRGADFSIGYMF